jgi:hypothetical protein
MEFQGGEIVRLLHDHSDDGLRAGDCGVLWGIYGKEFAPYGLEATFCKANDELKDLMFDEADIEVINIDSAPFPDRLRHIQWVLTAANDLFRRHPELVTGGSLRNAVAFAEDALARSPDLPA